MIDEHEDAIDVVAEEEITPVIKRHWVRRHWVSLSTIVAIVVLSLVIYFTGGLTGDAHI